VTSDCQCPARLTVTDAPRSTRLLPRVHRARGPIADAWRIRFNRNYFDVCVTNSVSELDVNSHTRRAGAARDGDPAGESSHLSRHARDAESDFCVVCCVETLPDPDRPSSHSLKDSPPSRHAIARESRRHTYLIAHTTAPPAEREPETSTEIDIYVRRKAGNPLDSELHGAQIVLPTRNTHRRRQPTQSTMESTVSLASVLSASRESISLASRLPPPSLHHRPLRCRRDVRSRRHVMRRVRCRRRSTRCCSSSRSPTA
jgi:hypothetical protein